MKNGPYNLIIAPSGYPGKKYRGRYAYEHTVKFWKVKGIVPGPGYEIHHKNMDHRDNRISNLQLVTSAEHRKLHGKIRSSKAMVVIKCGYCGKDKKLLKSQLRIRIERNKYSKVFCNAKCGADNQHSGVA